MIFDQGTIELAVYEDSVEYCGIAKVTRPDVNFLTQSIQGAGLGGNIEAIYPHLDAMTLGLDFRSITEQNVKLAEPRRHQIELRTAQQHEDTVAGTVEAIATKDVMIVIPKSTKGGNIAPASPTDGSGEYAVRYWAQYIDGKKVMELDPMNYICLINGTDYLANVRAALGK